ATHAERRAPRSRARDPGGLPHSAGLDVPRRRSLHRGRTRGDQPGTRTRPPRPASPRCVPERSRSRARSDRPPPDRALGPRALLESRILTAASGTGLRVGRMERRSIEVTEPIHDLVSPSSRVLCEATVEGEPLGLVELPVCDGRIPSRVLADALAASLGWPL